MSFGHEEPARILIIEDNPADVLLMRYALDGLNEPYLLTVLADGEEALAFVAEHRLGIHQPEPCVIVLDLGLPKHDGIAVLKAIKGEPELAHIHVVALTTFASPATESIIRQLGARAYRNKPSNLEDFHELAAEILAICKDGLAAAA